MKGGCHDCGQPAKAGQYLTGSPRRCPRDNMRAVNNGECPKCRRGLLADGCTACDGATSPPPGARRGTWRPTKPVPVTPKSAKSTGVASRAVEATLPMDLRATYRALVDDYAFASLTRVGKEWVAYTVLADLVRAGWREGDVEGKRRSVTA